jgi:hypothetical protein
MAVSPAATTNGGRRLRPHQSVNGATRRCSYVRAEAMIWLSDQIRMGGILPFESLEPIDPTLSVEETLHRRMQAEWRDRLAWHQTRHDLASGFAIRR